MDYSRFTGTPTDYFDESGEMKNGFWYKITINHGPGHQSRDTFYQWSDYELEDSEKKELFEWCCYGEYWDWPIGDVELLEHLPDNIRAEKIEECKDQITSAQIMLKVLGAED